MNKNQREVAKNFVERWKDSGSEKSESQTFWLSLLRDVLGVEKPEDYIRFEEPVQLSHKTYQQAKRNGQFEEYFDDDTIAVIESQKETNVLQKELNQASVKLVETEVSSRQIPVLEAQNENLKEEIEKLKKRSLLERIINK